MTTKDLKGKRIIISVKKTVNAEGFASMAERKLGKSFTALELANMVRDFYSEVAIEELTECLTAELVK